MKRVTRLLVAVVALTLTVSTAVAAAEPSTSPEASAAGPCSLLTADEVSAALGEPLPPNEVSSFACVYGDPTGSATGVTIAQITGSDGAALLEQLQTLGLPESTVGGAPAFQAPPAPAGNGLVASQVAVATGADMVLLVAVTAPEDVDVAAAALALAGLAVPRLGEITPPPLASAAASDPGSSVVPAVSAAPSGPPASAAALTGLAALFPSQIGGSPVTINEMSGRQFMSQVINFRPMEQRVARALRRRDLGVGDLSYAVGTPESQSSIVLAFQVDGGRIGPLVNVLLEALTLQRTGDEPRPEDVAGKEGVFEVLSGAEGYAYASGDALWIVFSEGSELTEIFEHLP